MKLKIKKSNLIIIIILWLLCFLIAINAIVGHLHKFIAILFFLMLLLVIAQHLQIPRIFSLLAISLFLLKVLVLLLPQINLFAFPDSTHYINSLNIMISSDNIGLDSVVKETGTLQIGYYYFIYFIYNLFKCEYAIVVANTFLTSVSCLLFYKIVNSDFGNKISFHTFIASLVSTNLFIFGSFILKDSLVLFLSILALYVYKNHQKQLLAVMLILILICTVRIYTGFAIGAGILCDMFFNRHSSIKTRYKVTLVVVGTILFLLIMRINYFKSYFELIVRYEASNSLLKLISAVPITLFKFYFSPLPWNLLESITIYTFTITDSVIFWLFSFSLLLFIFKIIKYHNLRKKLYIYIIPILVHASVLGVEYGGDSTRQRMGIFLFLILTLTIGANYKNKANA